MISYSQKSEVSASQNISIWIFGDFSRFFFQYNPINGTSKFPFHNPLAIKYYNFF